MTNKDALCANCGAHLENWHGTLGEHDCKQPTDLFGPLTPPRGVEEPAPAKSYVCNEAGECGFAECTAAEAHTHNEPPLHGPRECGFTHQVVQCEEVPELVRCDTADDCGVGRCGHRSAHAAAAAPGRIMPFSTCAHQPFGVYCERVEARVRCNPVPIAEHLRGVCFSGKVVEVLSMLKGMDPDEWDDLWAMVTGKMEPSEVTVHHQKRPGPAMDDANGPGVRAPWRRSADAKRVMAEANGPGVPDAVTAAVWEKSVRVILVTTFGYRYAFPTISAKDFDSALARIVELPRPETP